MPSKSVPGIRQAALALVVVAGLGSSVLLVEAGPTPSATALAPGAAALRVAIDPDTGLLVPATVDPGKAADAELATMLSRSSAGLVEVVHPDGRVSVDLRGRFMCASVARLNADGELQTTCVENHDHAADYLAGGDAAQPEVK